MKELIVRSGIDGKTIYFIMQWDGEKTLPTYAMKGMSMTIDGWIEKGLVDWIGYHKDKRQRVTKSDSPDFIYNLADYLREHYQMKIEIITFEDK